MKAFIKFMASLNGRIVSIVVGVVLILVGFFAVENTTLGSIVMIIGLIPLAAGIFDFCLLAPLFGMPVNGKKIRGG